jgi:hypothetical protein
MTHPMQPIELDSHGVYRFRENEIVSYLIRNSNLGLNELVILHHQRPFHVKDWEQLLQLIGYSVSGYGDYLQNDLVTQDSVDEADAIVSQMIEADKLAKAIIYHATEINKLSPEKDLPTA